MAKMSHSAAMDQILVDVLIRKRKWQWITYKLRKSDNSIAGYVMKWNRYPRIAEEWVTLELPGVEQWRNASFPSIAMVDALYCT